MRTKRQPGRHVQIFWARSVLTTVRWTARRSGGSTQVSYKDYWDDLMGLMSDNIAGQDNVITELRLYNEIVYQICTHYDAFPGGRAYSGRNERSTESDYNGGKCG